mgnify:CR=1 FL=1
MADASVPQYSLISEDKHKLHTKIAGSMGNCGVSTLQALSKSSNDPQHVAILKLQSQVANCKKLLSKKPHVSTYYVAIRTADLVIWPLHKSK